MTSDADHETLRRAVEVAVYAPLGAAAYLADVAPDLVGMLVARGRSELDRRQEDVSTRVRHVRSLGQVAMAFGVPALRERAEARVGAVRRRVEEAVPLLTPVPPAGTSSGARAAPPGGDDARPASSGPGRPDREASPGVAPAAGAGAPDGDAAGDPDPGRPRREAVAALPIPGYDALSASQVVQRLTGLGEPDLEAIRRYEAAHRNRRTILGKIDQITA